MDFRAAIAVHLCLLVAQGACRGVPPNVKETMKVLRTHLQPVLENLSNLYRNHSCRHLNSTELGEPQEEHVTKAHLSSFRCYTHKASTDLPQVSQMTSLRSNLSSTVQYLASMEARMEGSPREDCSLPKGLTRHNHQFQYVWCLLQRLDQRLSKAIV